MCHLESPRYTKEQKLRILSPDKIADVLDDIRVKCYESVRHLLSQYTSWQTADHTIDTMVSWIWYFHSSVSVVQSENPIGNIPHCTNHSQWQTYSKTTVVYFPVFAKSTEYKWTVLFNLEMAWHDFPRRPNEYWKDFIRSISYLLKFWLSIRILTYALKCSGRSITGILTFSNSWI